MKSITRRQLLGFSTLITLSCALSPGIASNKGVLTAEENSFPNTAAILKKAFSQEMTAHRHYEGFCLMALKEDYPNIAYLFNAFSVSERIHADNYRRVLAQIGAKPDEPAKAVTVLSTKENLQTASRREMAKIDTLYPHFLRQLRIESYDQAVVACMYSWKSHHQHKDSITQIKRYTPLFFGSVAKEIETKKLDFHVCEICGSTIEEAPEKPCFICNHPMSHYIKIKRV